MTISLKTASDMQIKQAEDIILTKSMRQGIEANAFDFSKEADPSGKVIRKTIAVKNGLNKDDAKKIVKIIEDSGLKVQPAISGCSAKRCRTSTLCISARKTGVGWATTVFRS